MLQPLLDPLATLLYCRPITWLPALVWISLPVACHAGRRGPPGRARACSSSGGRLYLGRGGKRARQLRAASAAAAPHPESQARACDAYTVPADPSARSMPASAKARHGSAAPKQLHSLHQFTDGALSGRVVHLLCSGNTVDAAPAPAVSSAAELEVYEALHAWVHNVSGFVSLQPPHSGMLFDAKGCSVQRSWRSWW
jgi:hypothetical protein